MKTVVIVVDGMRPDALQNVKNAMELIKQSSYSLCATTVMPSVTLPCHMSLFHSVDPGRHGTTTNVYAPQVRPIDGICEVLARSGKACAFFYNWEELRDLARPGSLDYSYYYKGGSHGYDVANNKVTDAAIDYITAEQPDFAFVYLGFTDAAGHTYGWLSPEYYDAMENSWRNIRRLIDSLPQDYSVILTSDHGGHDRAHGADIPEDMQIPIIALGKPFKAGQDLGAINIMDIAPTITTLLAVPPCGDWEGKSFL